ncbi:ABC transporter permease [Roseivirga sp. E12]|uniref:ABC transporter permease n=1 Tax=Roseivirga sp. E12 TaxID=2819237 RepID=UPI001ABCA385|nr:ABC transporter permease [Roseivirga sp. E12]MBO3699790.1 ABC transporter permease [Roseivirga sp. E12]
MLKRFALWLFRGYCHPDFQEDILGDLDEYYESNFLRKGKRYAEAKFLVDVILLFRLSLLRKHLNTRQTIYTAMVKNIFKTALRIFWKERGYSVMNIMGLTVGIAASMLLLLYVQSEKSVNQFHKDIDNIYQVMEHQTYPGAIYSYESNPGPLVTAFKGDMPEVEYMAAFTWPEEMLFVLNGQGYKETGRWASEDFFHIFDVDFLEGQKENSLTDPTKVYISKSFKERIFGNQAALSQTIEIDGWGQYQVGGVFEDVPSETTIDFDFIMPYEPWRVRNNWVEEWGNNGIRGLAKLMPGVDMHDFNAKIEGYVDGKMPDEESIIRIFVQPFKDRYLYNKYENGVIVGGRITYVKLFTAVAFFILLIAVINFMNLSTARSTKRAKEVGVKKVVGSTRSQLQFQFMLESVLLALISTLLAGFLISIVIQPLNHLVGKEMTFSLIQWDQSLLLVSLGLGVGILAGIYPSFVLSGFKALSVLKGSFKSSGWSNGMRKGLVVFQFTISTVLIISTLIIRSQMDYIKGKNLGYEKEHLVTLPVEGVLQNESIREQLKTSILSNPNFTHASFSSGTPIGIESSTSGGYSWEGKEGDHDNNFYIIRSDADFTDTYGMEIIEGRGFDKNLATDTMNLIINEQTAKIMNLEDPFSVPVTFWNRTGRVIGIVKDFHFSSLHESIEPMLISYRPNFTSTLTLRITGQNIPESLEYLEGLVTELNPNYPFDYSFVDESYEQLYQSESTISILTDYFSGIAVFISLLGLFGLSSFAAEQRIKEIGVRKVLGANIFNLILLMSKGFLFLVGIGFVLAAPLGYTFMNNWLESFEYRTQIGVSVFILAASISLLITILTVSYHALKAAYANPVKSLRYE